MKIKHLLLIGLIILVSACKNNSDKKSSASSSASLESQRIISLNGAVTEIISALGHEKELVARDVTSVYPPWVKDSVPDLGHVRSLSIEALIQQNPDLILATESDMSEDLLKNIKRSGIDYKVFKQDYSIQGTKQLIREVAQFIKSDNDGQEMEDQIDQALKDIPKFKAPPKVLFIYARGAGTLMVAGKDTPMSNIIEIAGGVNAIQEFKNFKPLTAEALMKSDPDMVLLFNSGLASMNGKKGLIETIPALQETKAGKNQAILAMDGGLLSGFGPRVGEAAKELHQLMSEYVEK